MSDTQPNVDELDKILEDYRRTLDTIVANAILGTPVKISLPHDKTLRQAISALITQAKQQTCDDIVGLLPSDNVVTKEFGYNSGEKKFGLRIGVAATIKAIKQYREGL